MSNSEIEHLEVEIDQAKDMISLNDDLVQLQEDPRFIRVITKGFFEQEAIRLVMLQSDPEMQKPERKEALVAAMNAVSGLNQYFVRVNRVGEMAKEALDDMHVTHAELLNEE